MNIDAGSLVNITLALLATIGAWVGGYIAIRADLVRLHERTQVALTAAERAHDRIDDLVRSKDFDRRRSSEQ